MDLLVALGENVETGRALYVRRRLGWLRKSERGGFYTAGVLSFLKGIRVGHR